MSYSATRKCVDKRPRSKHSKANNQEPSTPPSNHQPLYTAKFHHSTPSIFLWAPCHACVTDCNCNEAEAIYG